LLVVGFSLLGLLVVLYVSGALLPLILRLLGTQSVGQTDSLFTDNRPQPTLAVVDPGPPPNRVTIDLGRYGQETVTVDTRNYTVNASTTSNNATVSFSESGLLAICHERSSVCRNGNGEIREIQIDLRPGGAVIYAEAFTGLNWQRIGIVLEVDDFTGASFTVTGVDVGGVTYNPGSLPFGLGETVGATVRDIETEGNAILRQLIIDAGATDYRLSTISVDENALTLNLR